MTGYSVKCGRTSALSDHDRDVVRRLAVKARVQRADDTDRSPGALVLAARAAPHVDAKEPEPVVREAADVLGVPVPTCAREGALEVFA